MVLTTTGKNEIRDAIDSALSQGQMGTDTTAASPADTGLGSAVASTLQSLTTTKTDKQITVNYELNSTTGNGNTLTEYENRTSSGNLNRVTFAGIAKTSDLEVNVVTTLFIK